MKQNAYMTIKIFRRRLAALVLGFSLLAAGLAPAQQNGGQTAERSLIDLHRAIEASEALLANHPNSEFTPNVMFQLIELYYMLATDAYQDRMGQYEEELVKFENGELRQQPELPTVSFENVYRVANQLIERYPTAPFIDKIYYRVAVCYLQEGKADKAVAYFNNLTDQFDRSKFVDEVNFRLGEQMFDQQKFREAIEHYNKLLESIDSPFFSMALYKLGWSYYNISEHARAISTFIYLIDDLSRIEKANAQSPGTSNADLREEAISYVAESFAENGGARAAERFLMDFGEKEYSKQIFIRLGEIYQERNFYDESIETYAAMLRLWPLHHTAPEVQQKIIENYVRMEKHDFAQKAREAFVANYGPGSAWLAKHPDGEGREKALKLAEDNLYVLATQAQKTGIETKSRHDLNKAIAWYQEFIDKFPTSERVSQVQFYQAEAYYEVGDYDNAQRAYENVLVDSRAGKFSADAAYNRVLSAFNQLERAPAGGDSVVYYIENFLGQGKTYPVKVPNQQYGQMLQACNDFSRYALSSDKAPEVLMKYGEALFNVQQFMLARDAYTQVVNRGVHTTYNIQAYNMIAQSAFQAGDYATAEKWYNRLKAEYPDSIRYVERASTMMASAQFKQAENLKTQGRSDEAARAFQNIAANTANPEIAERSLLQAASEYEATGDLRNAIIIYENLRYRIPKSDRIPEALYKAALLCEQLPNFARAAQNYRELARLYPNSEYAARAIYSAAQAYEKTDNKAEAAALYEQYAGNLQDSPNKYLEALVKAGEYAYEQREDAKARQKFTQALSEYARFQREGKEVDVFLPAQAQFKLAQLLFSDYRKVGIANSRELQRKQDLLKEINAACKNAISFNVVDWTSASLYLLGLTWEEFARAFSDAPVPSMEADERVQYMAALRQKIEPWKKEALKNYQANLTLAERTNIRNDWVEKSRIRAEKLMAELGGESGAISPGNGAAMQDAPQGTPPARAGQN